MVRRGDPHGPAGDYQGRSNPRDRSQLASRGRTRGGGPGEHHARAVLVREELGTTGIGQGVAVLDTRPLAVNRVIGTVARSRRGVEWDALDGEPVDVLFLLISPSSQPGNHLLCLEIIGWHVYRDEHFVARIRQAQTPEQVIALLDEADRVLGRVPKPRRAEAIAPAGRGGSRRSVRPGACSRSSSSRTTIPRNRGTSRLWSGRSGLRRSS